MSLINKSVHRTLIRAFACSLLAALGGACAISRAPETGRPRLNAPAYPILLNASDERRERALAVWATLTAEQGITNPPAPELHPVTATLRALPALDQPLRLPNVGDEKSAEVGTGEEATRESLRRFIISAAPLLGVDPQYLTLVGIVDDGGGLKRAQYLHKPFLYPVRGGFGVLDITFAPDRRVTRLSSTAVPITGRITRTIASRRELLLPQDAVKALSGRTITYKDAAGLTQTYTSTGRAEEFSAREIVVYPVRRDGDQPALAFHLAWEVAVSGGGEAAPSLLIYVDAVTGETLAAVAPSSPEADVAGAK